ncbi:hypothetical protein [Mycobacterium ostraviense]|uniref:ESX-1 scaffolding and assembly protein SaeC n=1 Tax=Mycobacterium ostraviense TaxID=2738409 RepID=A0A162D5Q9_9MYCO|nr:hypothetical protein [Mycobacterium ostraviense]KZS62974.1 hypothetical protein A4G28_26315 [Mycobacterium ostraviense]UGT93765.1 hypothetical protein LTS72_11380 [Mycobacterium ostraviense]
MTKCPRCFSVLSDDHYAWIVDPRIAGIPRYADAAASAYYGAAVTSPPVYDAKRPPGYKGRLHTAADASAAMNGLPVVEICPICHFELPGGWRQGQAVCIAMAGARATGKSIYIAVLIKQMELLCETLSVSMSPTTQASAQAYAVNYEQPLYVQRGLIPPTPTVRTQASHQREPLIFSIGAWLGVPSFVVLRDVAGEDLEAGNTYAPHFRFFADADAVFFMFDPLRVKGVRDQLQDLLPAPSSTGGDPRSVLSNVMLAVGTGRPKLAVIVSKFDALRALRDVEGSDWSYVMSNSGASYLRDSAASRQYDDADGQLLHEEVRSLLLRLQGGSVVTAVEHPFTGVPLPHRYFAVSALGQPPDGNRLNVRGIAPFRCTDPLRWVTSSFGVL